MTSKLTKRGFLRALPLVLIDTVATFAAYAVAAWGTQVGGALAQPSSFGHIAFFALVNVVVYAACRMYSCLWEYASIDEAMRLISASFLSSLAGSILGYGLLGARLPLRVYVVAWLLFLGVTAAARFALRVYSGRKSWSLFGASSEGMPRTLVVGAGESGSMTVKRMLSCDQSIVGCPVALVDDNRIKLGTYVHGVKVMGTCDDIEALSKRLGVEQIVIAIPSATREQRDRVLAQCMKTELRVLTLPDIKDIPAGELDQAVLREVEVADLLARDEVELNLGQMAYVAGKRVLVTGGGGSIGSELVRQLLPAKPVKIVLFDIYENTTYELLHEVKGQAADLGVQIAVEIGSITHMPALQKCFADHKPQVVFHAAAHKHVPLMEANPREAIENNVFGTLNLVRIAHEQGCTHFILISTDKAVNPVNVMGATKRMCEMIVQCYASMSDTVFAAVRFGNVLGSHGSVIPLFKRQLRDGGPITVTHKDITRYFMTIPEASRLVIAAGALARGGEIFILDMGEPVRIWDLAENLVRLSGLKPGRDIQIVETGLRPGEKMFEELLMDEDEPLPTDNPGITVSRASAPEVDDVRARIELLEGSLNGTNNAIKRVLAEAVPTYQPELHDGKTDTHAA
ncbi:polysaccharide biosynthesis protein [Adlercreutzia sp. ZJ141]|uniref:polysaccharide biosynthesis protein n=1 Tax=Adlercreutzia sp. ZJ141 TaxID=2709406 RepID=UPI0013EB7E6F|nr:nucleoside-diphosphate sugar epimerase/dehydratase [Adlercreutzia sp. ZJ141]